MAELKEADAKNSVTYYITYVELIAYQELLEKEVPVSGAIAWVGKIITVCFY
jgi:hypothetical protein